MMAEDDSPHYIVIPSKRYSSKYGMIFCITRFASNTDRRGNVMEWFELPPDIPDGSLRRLILDKTEDIIKTRNVVTPEVPVLTTWNGRRFLDTPVFGRMI